jgi:cholesterol transport system auxiliary component
MRLCAIALTVSLAGACSGLRPTVTPNAVFYALDAAPAVSAPPGAGMQNKALTTLVVNPPHASAGFDSHRIIYTREPQHREYFANSEWVDTPARMIAPMLAATIAKTGAFRAVVLTPSAATGDMRLDTEITRLQHDFRGGESHVRFGLRAYLVDSSTRRVLAWREFDATVKATSEDARGGVLAAGEAVRSVLEQLAAFCAEASRITPEPGITRTYVTPTPGENTK